MATLRGECSLSLLFPMSVVGLFRVRDEMMGAVVPAWMSALRVFLLPLVLPAGLWAQGVAPPDASLYSTPMTLSSSAGFIPEGGASALSLRCHLLTPLNSSDRSAQLWWDERLDITQNLRFQFAVNFGNDSRGGHGISFVMHDDDDGFSAAGNPRTGVGFGAPTHYRTSTTEALNFIAPSLAIATNTGATLGRGDGGDRGGERCVGGGRRVADLSDGFAWGGAIPYRTEEVLSLIRHGETCHPIAFQTLNESNLIVSERQRSVLGIEDPAVCYMYDFYWTYVSEAVQRIELFVDGALWLRYEGDIVDDFFGGSTDVIVGLTAGTGRPPEDADHVVCLPPEGTYSITAVDDSLSAVAGSGQTFDLLANDIAASPEVNSDNIAIVRAGVSMGVNSLSDQGGTLTVRDAGRSVSYVPPFGFRGEDTFTYRICDNPADACYAECAEATATVDVECPSVSIEFGDVLNDVRCAEDVPPRGAVASRVVKASRSLSYSEDFSAASVGDGSGTTQQEDGTSASWELVRGGGSAIETYVFSVSEVDGNLVAYEPRVAGYPCSITLEWDFAAPPSVESVLVAFQAGVVRSGSGPVSWRMELVHPRRLRTLHGTVITLTPRQVTSQGSLTGPYAVGQLTPLSEEFRLEGYLDGSPLEEGDPINVTISLNYCNTVARLYIDNLSIQFFPVPGEEFLITATDSYTIRWYEGASVDPSQLIYTGATYPGVGPGLYTLQGESSIFPGCFTSEEQITVDRVNPGDQLAEGQAAVQQTNPFTDCSSPNGALSAYVTLSSDGARATSGYTYTWYATRDLTSPISYEAAASSLDATEYTVFVREETTGCEVNLSRTVTSSFIAPSLSVGTVTKDAECNGVSLGVGSIQASSSDSGVDFLWYDGPSVQPTPSHVGSEYSNLSGGDYTVVARFIDTGCQSPAETVRVGVEDLSVTVTATPTANTACSAPFNGFISSVAAEGSSPAGTFGYNFSYYSGAGVDAANLISTTSSTGDGPYVGGPSNSRLYRLPSGSYTVLVENDAGCAQQLVVTVDNSPTLPVVDASSITVTGDAQCDPSIGSGQINASSAVTTGGVPAPSGYTYKLYTQPTRTLHSENTTGQFTSLLAGQYELEVTEQGTGCSPASSTFLNVDDLNNLSLSPSAVTGDRSCDGALGNTGSFSVSVSVLIPTSSFDFSLYSGGVAADPALRTFSEPSGSQEFNGLSTGLYTVRVQDPHGCQQDISLTVPTVDGTPALSPAPAVRDRNSCRDANGSITASVEDWSGAAVTDPAADGYTFEWRAGDATGTIIPGTGAILADLAEGLYTVAVTDALGCRSTSETVTVRQAAVTPDPTLSLTTPLTACQASDADGILGVSLAVPDASVTYEWFSGTPGGTVIGTGASLTGVWEGQYSVRARSSADCQGERSIDVASSRLSPQLTVSNIVGDSSCAPPPTGYVDVTVSRGGASVTDISAYTFFLDGTAQSVLERSSGIFSYEELGGQTYALSTQHLGCDSNVVSALVTQLPPIPSFDATITDSTSCDTVNNPNGAIALSPSDGSDASLYAYSWSSGSPYDASAPYPNATNPATTASLSALPPGTYSVRITRNGCFVDSSYTVGHSLVALPTFDRFDEDLVAHCSPFDGRLTAHLTGAPDSALYDWYWYEGDADDPDRLLDDPTTTAADPGTSVGFTVGAISQNVASGLRDGVFSVRYVERATSCRSPLQVHGGLGRTADAQFFVATTLDTPAGDCTGALGEMDVVVTNSGGHPFDLLVYRGDLPDLSAATLATAVVETTRNGVATGASERFQLSSRTYTIVATDTTTACTENVRFSMPYANAPTILSIVQVLDSGNCKPYLDGAGRAGAGGASGSLDVEFSVESMNPDNHSDYVLFLYQGMAAYPEPVMSIPGAPPGTPTWPDIAPLDIQSLTPTDVTPDASGNKVAVYTFSNLAPGDYTVMAARIGVESCFSEARTDVVAEDHDELTIPTSAISTSNNTSCSGTPTGSLSITSITRGADVDATTPELTGSYSYEWSLSPTFSPLLTLSGPEATALEAGTYYIRIEKTDTARGDDDGCVVEVSAAVSSDTEALALERIDAVAITACNDLSAGSLTVVEVEAGGATGTDFTTLSSDYDVEVKDIMGTVHSSSPLTPGAAVLSGLTADSYSFQLINTVTQCRSGTHVATVDDERIFPTVSPSLITPHDNCTSPDGLVTAAHPTTPVIAAGDATYSWHTGDDTTTPSIGTALTLSGQEAGRYTLFARHTASTCEVTNTFVIPDERVYPVLQLPADRLSENVFCTGENGAIEVQSDDISPAASYTVDLLQSGVVQSTQTLSVPGSLLFDALAAGDYALRATSAEGCQNAVPTALTIPDNTDPPVLTDILTEDDVGCTLTLGVAAVEVVIGPQDADRNSAQDTYTVTIGSDVATGVAARRQVVGALGPSVAYTVRNEASGCEVAGTVAFGPAEEPNFLIQELEETSVQRCDPANGSAWVRSVLFHETDYQQPPGAASVFSDFDFEWTDADGNSVPPSTEPYEADDLAPGVVYTVAVTHRATACEETRSFTVEDETVAPIASVGVVSADQSCGAGGASGAAEGFADGQSDANPLYAFSWRDGVGTEIATTSQLSGVSEGTYSLQVTNTDTGCQAEATAVVASEPLDFFFETSATIVTNCEPGDGSLEIDSVSEGSLSDYTFSRYTVPPSPTETPSETKNGSTVVFGGLGLGPHYIRAVHDVLGCEEVSGALTLPDGTTPPEVVLADVVLQTLCDPDLGNGVLQAAPADGNPLDYTYEWYDSQGNRVSESAVAEGLVAGIYRVIIRSNDTGCTATRLYTLREAALNPLSLKVHVSGNNRCDEPYNGALSADVLYGLDGVDWRGSYEFLWRKGSVEPLPDDYDYSGIAINELNGGIYSLKAYHREDPSCVSLPMTVRVPDLREFPEAEIALLSPLSNCHSDRPNGELTVQLAEGSLIDYRFEWKKGALASETISQAPTLSRQTAGEYFLRVVDNVTRCATVDAYALTPSFDHPLPPRLLLERNNASCLEPDGRVRAEQVGAFDPLIFFEWYEGERSSEGEPFFVGTRAEGLRDGEYSVYSFHQSSGCHSSEPSLITVYNSGIEPAYSIETRKSYCMRSTGSARVFGKAPVVIERVVWEVGGEFIEGPELTQVPAGDYRVHVTDQSGCETVEEFSIGFEVVVYNGVSDNADGANDELVVECIEEFPNNQVRLFNSDGVLVFEQSGYRNERPFMFNGRNATNGAAVLRGTYFYVIELGDGQKPVTGYIEVLQ